MWSLKSARTEDGVNYALRFALTTVVIDVRNGANPLGGGPGICGMLCECDSRQVYFVSKPLGTAIVGCESESYPTDEPNGVNGLVTFLQPDEEQIYSRNQVHKPGGHPFPVSHHSNCRANFNSQFTELTISMVYQKQLN